MRCMGQGVTVELPHSLVSRRVNDRLNGFQPLFLSCVIAEDRASIVALCQSAPGQ